MINNNFERNYELCIMNYELKLLLLYNETAIIKI